MKLAACVLAFSLTVTDGDTIRLGEERIRLLGFDTPEIRHAKYSRELALGYRAKERLRELLHSGCVEIVRRSRKDKYRRTLAHVFVNGEDVASIAIRERWGRSYFGGKRKPWCRPGDR